MKGIEIMALQKVNQEEFDKIVRLHEKWIIENSQVSLGRRATFQKADLRDIHFYYTCLRYSEFRDCDLRGADLSHFDFRRSDLRGTDLRGADLSCVNFTDVDLRGTKFDRYIPHYCIIRGTKWLSSDIPWWLGHPQQDQIILYKE